MEINSTPNFTIQYAASSNTKKTAMLVPKNDAFSDQLEITHLQNEANQLSFAYTDGKEFIREMEQLNAIPFLTEEALANKLLEQENALTLTPGTRLYLGADSGQDIFLTVGSNGISLSTGRTALGSAYVEEKNKLIREMLNVTDPNEVPDLSKLTKEDLETLKNMEEAFQQAVSQLGGSQQYEALNKIAESFGSLIRYANGQASFIPVEYNGAIKDGLEKAGIDTTQPFYVNGQKLMFNEYGILTKISF